MKNKENTARALVECIRACEEAICWCCNSRENATKCVQACNVCVDCCQLALKLCHGSWSSLSDECLQLCVNACRECSQECSKFKETECKNCVKACEKCVEECAISSKVASSA